MKNLRKMILNETKTTTMTKNSTFVYEDDIIDLTMFEPNKLIIDLHNDVLFNFSIKVNDVSYFNKNKIQFKNINSWGSANINVDLEISKNKLNNSPSKISKFLFNVKQMEDKYTYLEFKLKCIEDLKFSKDMNKLYSKIIFEDKDLSIEEFEEIVEEYFSKT